MIIGVLAAVASSNLIFVPTYETLSLVAQGSGGVTLSGNNTTTASFFKTSGTSNWDTQVYSTNGFPAPVTLEFVKQADATDNTVSYAMISLNEDPTTDNSYTSLDHAPYPYMQNNYVVYHSGGLSQEGGTWSSSNKFYIVYSTDGNVYHYNGSTLLYTEPYGISKTVYIDSSLNRVNATYGGFSSVRVTKNAWNGTAYQQQSYTYDSQVTLLSPKTITWPALSGASSYTVSASPSLGTITVSGRVATFASAMSSGTQYTFTITPNSGSSVTCSGMFLGYTGSSQTFITSSGINRRITLIGASGGGTTLATEGPLGGMTIGNYAGSGTMYVYVGGKGGNYCRNTYTTYTCANEPNEGQAGWNGGGSGGNNGSAYQGVNAGGGGATDIRINGTALSDRIMIAGGGSGYYNHNGGIGGGSVGGRGIRAYGFAGQGGTQSAGGIGGARPGYSGGDGGSGSLGTGGNGGACNTSWCLGGGAGGGGYYGGGGGEAGDASYNNGGSGGGGGSGYINTSVISNGATVPIGSSIANSGNGAFLAIWDVSGI